MITKKRVFTRNLIYAPRIDGPVQETVKASVQRAIEALRRGEPVLLYDADGREEEADMAIASEFVAPPPVLAGTVATSAPYDAVASPFSITINHRDTRTGVTDRDRALTISRFAQMVAEALRHENGWALEALGREFRSPGHVPLLNAADGLVARRRGHTELTTALVTMAGLIPSATICEMMADDGRALSKEDAKEYAEAKNLVFLEGQDVIEAWRAWSG